MIAGIDPGYTGGIAILSDNGNAISNLYDMPILDIGKGKKYLDGNRIREIFLECEVKVVFIEKAQTMPGQGISSTGAYMKAAGIIEGICIGMEISYELVHPMSWKRAILKDMPKGKEASILKCKQLFPGWTLNRKKDHGICDAALIALYGIRNILKC